MTTNQITHLIAVAASALLISSCSTTKKTIVNARVWPTADRPQFYPEQDDPEYSVAGLRGIRNDPGGLGVAFSGGGTRSASATLGQLRMLHKLGWINQVDYIAAVSGGAWASLPYVYLPEKFDDDTFLSMDRYRHPGEITDKLLDLEKKDEQSLAYAIRDSTLAIKIAKAWMTLKGDGGFASILNSIFLKRFELNDKTKFFTWDDATAARIEAASRPNGPRHSDFYTVRPGRPYIVVGGTLQKKHKLLQVKRAASDIYPFVMTPHYAGVPTMMDVFAHDRFHVGGGYVESAGYDSRPPASLDLSSPDPLRVPLEIRSTRYRFTLADVIAISGSAPQGPLTGGLRYLTLGLASNLGLPELEHWPILEHGSDPYRDDQVHGDGGNLENTGLHMLLARGVKNIVVFVNTADAFNREVAGLADGQALGRDQAHRINSDDGDNITSSIEVCFKSKKSKPYNKVIHGSKLVDLFNAYSEIDRKNEQDGGMRPLVHVDEYQILRNDWHNIAPYKARIAWVCLYAPPGWKNAIADTGPVTKDLRAGAGKFKGFPHYKTFLTQGQGMQLIDLSREQVNALANLTSWTLEVSANKIRNGLHPQVRLK